MTPAEIAVWWRTNRSITAAADRDDSPCRDCSQLFANGMRLVGRCNGSYPGEITAPEPPGRSRAWAYVTEDERIEARRRSWRGSSRRQRAQASA
jgi:hypothetical protein